MFPEVAAAPAGHDQNSLVVGEIEEFLGFELAFEADRVEPHIAHVTKFVVQTLRVLAEHQVWSPAAAADEDVFAVHLKLAAARGIDFRGYLANAEFGFGAIAQGTADIKLHGDWVKVLFAHLRGPPKARVRDHELPILSRSEREVSGFVGIQFYGCVEGYISDSPF